MSAVGIIPARFAATRFPGKPLAPIAGVPMVQRVWQGACEAKRLRTVIVATDDARVAEACRGFGAEVALTSPEHPTGTDRIAEVAAKLADEIVLNVQGDEPLIAGFVIDAAVEALEAAPEVAMATVVHPMAGSPDDPTSSGIHGPDPAPQGCRAQPGSAGEAVPAASRAMYVSVGQWRSRRRSRSETTARLKAASLPASRRRSSR